MGKSRPTPHFSDEAAEAQGSVRIYPRSHSKAEVERGTRPGRALFLAINSPVKERCPSEAEVRDLQEAGLHSERKFSPYRDLPRPKGSSREGARSWLSPPFLMQ